MSDHYKIARPDVSDLFEIAMLDASDLFKIGRPDTSDLFEIGRPDTSDLFKIGRPDTSGHYDSCWHDASEHLVLRLSTDFKFSLVPCQFIGLTLKCQLKRYHSCHHVLLLCYLKFQAIMPLGTPNFHQMSLVTPGMQMPTCQLAYMPTYLHAIMPTC